LAVGRLVRNKDGTFAKDKHQIIAQYAAEPDSQINATYVTHLTQIMNNGADKLKPNKRVRLTSDSNQYDLHLLADYVESNEQDMIVFFAVTDVDFGKAHSVTQLLEEFKNDLYANNAPEDVRKAKTGGNVHKVSQAFLAELTAKYGQDKLADTQDAVNGVIQEAKNNVQQVIGSMAAMEDTEEKARQLEAGAKTMQDNSIEVRKGFQWKYYKTTFIIGSIVLLVVLIIIIVVVTQSNKKSP